MVNPIPLEAIFSVSEFLDLANEMLKPLRVTVQGEITSLTIRGAAAYFNLTDKKEKAVLNCLVWKSKLYGMGIDLKEGLEVQVVGVPSIYKPFGKLSFQADYISPVGEGALKQAFEKLKKQLEQEGYFAESAKKPLPPYPQRIGLITSSQGDAIKDFQTHLGKYGYTIYHYDVRVEGLKAVDSITAAFAWFNEHPLQLDTLVLTRGGGSLESLQAFNTLAVAKAIFGSKIPVVSAIGHENDVTIADLVADVRASTPTDAGKIVSYNWSRLGKEIDALQSSFLRAFHQVLHTFQQTTRYQQKQLFTAFANQLHYSKQTVAQYQQIFLSFFPRLRQRFLYLSTAFSQNFALWFRQRAQFAQSLQRVTLNMSQSFERKMREQQKMLQNFEVQLRLSDPEIKLKQGYSIITNATGEVVRSAAQLTIGETLQVRLHQGKVQTKVEKVTEYGQ